MISPITRTGDRDATENPIFRCKHVNPVPLA
jgi:hypothetical protein